MMTPSDAMLRAEANNFTAVRLLLASLVIYTHCYWLTRGVGGKDDLSDFLGAPVSVFAVDGFFFLSGFLVYPSLMRLRSSGSFLFARFARLWPGLVVSILLTVLAGAFVTEARGVDYLKGDTARFILTNLSFLYGSYNLTGVNCGGEPCAVNGSLWTLPWEARCYLGLALLGVLGLAKPEPMKKIILPLTLAVGLVWDIPAVQEFTGSLLGAGAVDQFGKADRLWVLFALGTGAYLFREKLKLSWFLAGGLFLAMLLANQVGAGLHVRAVFIGYLVLCLGLLTARNGSFSKAWPDYSYGMYIYAFPIMMGVHALAPINSHLLLSAITFVLTVPFAAFSWHLVEKPVIEWVKRRRSRPSADLSKSLSATSVQPEH
jgi:peptidoglycan/LPS O-acetylase OafA/YrhL